MTQSNWRDVMIGQGAAYESFTADRVDLSTVGERPALLVIDVVTAFIGKEGQSLEESIREYPLSCGPAGWEALPRIRELLDMARSAGLPVIYTTGDKARVLGGALKAVIDNRGAAGEEVAEMPAIIAPEPGEPVLAKARASAFFGTVLTPLLHQRKVDSLIVCGTTTSGCIRASVIEGHSLGWPMIVAEDGCFDRAQLSHDVNLFEMNAKYAHVAPVAEIVQAFA